MSRIGIENAPGPGETLEADSLPVVSIIIPAFNEERFLPRCLGSIARVFWPKDRLEVIVVDNGSSDRTCDIARSHGAVVLSDSTKTVSGLRNLGAGRASGQILAFVDADCVVDPHWLNRARPYFSDAAVAAWGAPPGIPDRATWVQKAWYLLRQKKDRPAAVDWLESMNLFVRKDVFWRVKGFDESLETCEDVDFSYRIAALGAIVADPSMKVIHLGEAATVGHFIRKELWRGVGNFKGVFRHGLTLKEIPSLGIPVYFGLFLPCLLIAAGLFRHVWFAWGSALALLIPGCLILYKVRRKKAGMVQKLQLLFLVYVYFIVRTIAVLPLKR